MYPCRWSASKKTNSNAMEKIPNDGWKGVEIINIIINLWLVKNVNKCFKPYLYVTIEIVLIFYSYFCCLFKWYDLPFSSWANYARILLQWYHQTQMISPSTDCFWPGQWGRASPVLSTPSTPCSQTESDSQQ